jgi:hypothetical protein
MLVIVLIVVLLLAFGAGGSYFAYRRLATGGSIGIFGLVLILLVIFYVFGGVR